jgi:5-methylcytosine-specific restriction enzyme A
MPMAPPRACATCGQLQCAVHVKTAWRSASRPPTPRIRGRERMRRRYALLRAQPFCQHCGEAVASVRDHVTPLAEGGTEDDANTQALCDACHDRKTTAEATRGAIRHRGVGEC